MKKILVPVLCLFLVGLSACSCPAVKQAIEEVDKSHAIISKQLLKYVDADPNIAGAGATEEQKKAAREDWHKLVESDKRNMEKLKKASEE